jgi:hypothetical protein
MELLFDLGVAFLQRLKEKGPTVPLIHFGQLLFVGYKTAVPVRS